MTANRRYVLAAVVAALGIVTGAILLEVLGTILFAITVAYVLVPVHRWLVRRGFSEWTAGVLATLLAFVGVLAVFAPILFTLYLRLEDIVALVEQLPEEFSVVVFDVTMTIEATEVQAMAISAIQGAATSVATAAPVLAVKAALFVLLLFGLIIQGDAAARAAVAPIPREYRDIVFALATRARETLYAIYVIQVATGVATFLIAYPFFWLLGYESALVLATVAAILQFVPIIGPSLLIVPIALYQLAVGDVTGALLVGVVGMALIAWMPDVTVRPRLAQRSAGLPGSLYFIGFTGGLFTLGAIGIVVGPLIVAVFVEAVSLLAAEVNADQPLAELSDPSDADVEAGIDPNDEPAALAFDDETGDGAGTDRGDATQPALADRTDTDGDSS